MKEFEGSPIDFSKGLRRFYIRRNSDELDECHNFAPMENGLELHDALVSLNSTGTAWGGRGKLSAATATRDITIIVSDFVDGADVASASVYLDDVLQGTTGAGGEIDIADVDVGGHTLKITKAGYLDSDADDIIYNDYIVVT